MTKGEAVHPALYPACKSSRYATLRRQYKNADVSTSVPLLLVSTILVYAHAFIRYDAA